MLRANESSDFCWKFILEGLFTVSTGYLNVIQQGEKIIRFCSLLQLRNYIIQQCLGKRYFTDEVIQVYCVDWVLRRIITFKQINKMCAKLSWGHIRERLCQMKNNPGEK